MKKTFTTTICMIVCAMLIATQFGFLNNVSAATKVLKVYNWEDYHYEREEGFDYDFKEEFEAAYEAKFKEKITLEFSYFTTNEEMLTKIEAGKEDYDLACPSDYMIQQMLQKDLLKKVDKTKLENYSNISPFIQDKHTEIEAATGKVTAGDAYSVPYMWGTMGLLYNTAHFTDEQIAKMSENWDVLFDKEFKNKVLMKDSMRDTYIIAAIQAQKDVLGYLGEQYPDDYFDILDYFLNNTSEESIDRIENILIKQKKEVKPKYEVDEGKTDMATGKYWVNLAWSGDAIWAIQEAAEENGVELEYAVPKIGSNIWFDGWVMPKYGREENEQAAHFFLDFTLNSQTAIKNMDFIGYTSGVATEEVAQWISESAGEDATSADLDYFFAGTGITAPTTMMEYRYPTEDEIAYCAVMKDFGDKTQEIAQMWSRMKSNNTALTVTMIVVGSLLVAGAVVFLVIYLVKKKGNKGGGGGTPNHTAKQQTTAFRRETKTEEE